MVREHGHGGDALRERVLLALRGGGDGRPRGGEHGRSDLADDGSVYLFKVADGKPEGRTLAQIRERGYADKYRRMQIHLIGVEFGREERNIVDFRFETV